MLRSARGGARGVSAGVARRGRVSPPPPAHHPPMPPIGGGTDGRDGLELPDAAGGVSPTTMSSASHTRSVYAPAYSGWNDGVRVVVAVGDAENVGDADGVGVGVMDGVCDGVRVGVGVGGGVSVIVGESVSVNETDDDREYVAVAVWEGTSVSVNERDVESVGVCDSDADTDDHDCVRVRGGEMVCVIAGV